MKNEMLLLVLCAWSPLVVSSRDHHLGSSCDGEVLMEQRASTRSDAPEPFIVAYGGDPGERISCIATRDLSSLGNQTTSTLIGGGPGKRYAILSVASTDDTDADFVVKVFGMRQLQSRVKREDGSSTAKPTMTTLSSLITRSRRQAGSPTTSNPLASTTPKTVMLNINDRISKIIIQLRKMADSLENLQKILEFLQNPFGDMDEIWARIRATAHIDWL